MIKLNKFGFYSLINVSDNQELREYYADKYYQESSSSYEKIYSDEEILYINNKIEQKYELLRHLFPKNKTLKLLDIGCGEGFCLSFFKKHKWKVLSLGKYAIKRRPLNPLISYLKIG